MTDQPQQPAGNPGDTPDPLRPEGLTPEARERETRERAWRQGRAWGSKPVDPAGPYGPVEHHVPGDRPGMIHSPGDGNNTPLQPGEVPSWEEQIAEVEGGKPTVVDPDYHSNHPRPPGGAVEKAKVVASSTVTILSGLAVFLTLASPEIAQLFPENAEDITRWSVVIVGWLGTAVAALRRVTPVPGRLHGILPDPKVRFDPSTVKNARFQ